MAYAETTQVPADRSRAEIEKTLQRDGADQFLYGWDQAAAVIGFRLKGKMIRIRLPLPSVDSQDFTRTETGRPRTTKAAQDAYDLEVRRRWRALALVIKAKLEAVETGITTFEEEFLAHIILPDNRTAGEFILPQVEAAYQSGTMPALLPWKKEK